jgi:hypothetical protein
MSLLGDAENSKRTVQGTLNSARVSVETHPRLFSPWSWNIVQPRTNAPCGAAYDQASPTAPHNGRSQMIANSVPRVRYPPEITRRFLPVAVQCYSFREPSQIRLGRNLARSESAKMRRHELNIEQGDSNCLEVFDEPHEADL